MRSLERSTIISIIVTAIVGSIVLVVLYKNNYSLFLNAFGSFIGSCIAIFLYFEVSYLLDYKKHEKYLIAEIQNNWNNLKEFPRILDRVFASWSRGDIDWINKVVTTRLSINEVYHYLSDKAYIAFISKGFELNLSEETLQSLCPFYFYGKRFSEDTQNLEAIINSKIAKGEKLDHTVLTQYHQQFQAINVEYIKKISDYYKNLNRGGKISLK